MTPAAVGERAIYIANACDLASPMPADLEAGLVAVRELRAWLDGREAVLIRTLSDCVAFPEATIAAASKTSLHAANKTKERSDTLAATPGLAGALDDGSVTAGHIDAITRSAKQLNDTQRAELLERADTLTNIAAAGTIDQFNQRIKLETKHIQADDGIDRLTRQRRNTRLRTWVDGDGMWCIRGQFDPVTGITLAARLDTTREALFAEKTPDHCPTDPVERQQFLGAHALTHLISSTTDTATQTGTTEQNDTAPATSRPSPSRRPEYIAVIDADAPNQTGPVVEWSIPVELPARIIAELAADANVVGVVVRNGVVVYAPGELNLGRTTRLASRAQRRALHGLYKHCSIPGCTVNYDRCHLHHITWWRHGGRTDLDNLLPVCTRHHNNIHNNNWIVELGPNRQLTLTLPDGQIKNTGPPNRNTA